jgi:hypothetical protein
MSELDEAWNLALAEAEQRARAAGRKDIAEYLSLRNSNDLLRQTGISWIIETFMNLAGEANRSGAGVQITREEGHRFKVANSTMVGRMLTMRNGERALFVEAGWPRTPRDGFVAGGGLARANIRHRGIKSADLELLLSHSPGGPPQWMILAPERSRSMLRESHAREQILILLDHERTSR